MKQTRLGERWKGGWGGGMKQIYIGKRGREVGGGGHEINTSWGEGKGEWGGGGM